MDQTVVFFLASVIIIGGALFALISLTKRGQTNLDVDHYRIKWLAIEQQLRRDEVSSYHLSVLNADKLLDHALKAKGLKGETMAERLKNANAMFTNRNNVWSAHKLRNRIAHEPDVKVTYDTARYALGNFKRALKDIGAI